MGDWAPRSCAVVGIGQTEFSRASGRSTLTMAAEAVAAALDDAGLDPKQVDGIVRCDMDSVSAPALADSLGVENLTYWGDAGPGGSGPAAMVAQAIAAISAGLATSVVVFRSLNGRSGERYGLVEPVVDVGGGGSYDEFFLPHGMQTAGQFFAMTAQRYAFERCIGVEELAHGLGSIALAARAHANANPAAQFHDRPMTRDDYDASRLLSTPLRLFDYCLETDGACAIVVTTTARARDLRQPPATVVSAVQSTGAGVQPGLMFPALLRERITTWPSATAAPLLYARADLAPSDIDVAQIYDCFTFTALVQLEDYGLVDPGAGWAVDADELTIGGRIPLNTSGGHLSEGYLHGLNHVVEGVRQMRGTSTSQVVDAQHCLVTSAPPPGTSALILGVDR